MASITRKKTSRRWIACFTDAEGIQRQRSTKIADEGTPSERGEARRRAVEIAAEFEAAARGNRTEAQIRKVLTELYNRVNPKHRLEWSVIGAFLTTWKDRIKVRKSAATFARYGTVIDGFIESLGPKASAQLGDLTTEDFQKYIDAQIGRGKRAGTIRIELKILGAAMTYAFRQGLIVTNPVAAVDAPNDASESKRPFTADQISLLVAACDSAKWTKGDRIAGRLGDWKTTIMIGALTGLRLGDTCNLRWSSVDLVAKVLRVRPEKTKRQAKDVVIPLHPDLEARLLALPGSDNPAAFISPSLAGVKIGGRSGLSRQFQRIMEEAGIDNETLAGGDGKGRRMSALGFHSLRHYYVSALAEAGVAQDVRMALAGHSSAKVSELYTHRGLATLTQAVAKLPRL